MPVQPPNKTNAAANNNSSQVDYPQELKDKARGFFSKATEVAYTLNYDYAIELYLDGLNYWPDCVEEGHAPLREIAIRRQAAGKKKSGFGDNSKYKKLSSKNPKDAMLKAEYLLSKDPGNQGHMIDMIKAAVECGFTKTALWALDLLFNNNLHRDKPVFSTYIFLRDYFSRLKAYSRALQACQLALQLKPKDDNLKDAVRDLSAQATMQQGRYDDGSDFRDSIKDLDEQQKLMKKEMLVKSADTLQMEIEEARREYEAEPTSPGKIDKYVTALCNTEKLPNENLAIQILEKAFAQSKQFHFKQRSNEIRIKQIMRRVRQLQEQLRQNPQDKELQQKVQQTKKAALKAELAHYRECVEHFPTDLSLKYEYGRRLLQAGRYDEAIPLFQEARSNPRFRIKSLSAIGGCFFYKEWYADAIDSFEQALELLENKEGKLAQELLYNLGRAHEANNNLEEALNYYRKVARLDFNYLDAKDRVDALRKKLNNSRKQGH